MPVTSPAPQRTCSLRTGSSNATTLDPSFATHHPRLARKVQAPLCWSSLLQVAGCHDFFVWTGRCAVIVSQPSRAQFNSIQKPSKRTMHGAQRQPPADEPHNKAEHWPTRHCERHNCKFLTCSLPTQIWMTPVAGSNRRKWRDFSGTRTATLKPSPEVVDEPFSTGCSRPLRGPNVQKPGHVIVQPVAPACAMRRNDRIRMPCSFLPVKIWLKFE